jgi:ADP-ribose pyrophosphatase
MNGQVLYTAKNFSVRSGTFIRAETGEAKEVVYVDQPAVAVGIPLLSDGRILFAQQWRPLVGSVLLECPGGKVEPGESPEDALRRELSEEVGLFPRNVRRLGDYFSSVGASNEHIFFFLVSDLLLVERRQEDRKKIDLVYLTLSEARDHLRRSMFLDGKTMLALFTYMAQLEGTV